MNPGRIRGAVLAGAIAGLLGGAASVVVMGRWRTVETTILGDRLRVLASRNEELAAKVIRLADADRSLDAAKTDLERARRAVPTSSEFAVERLRRLATDAGVKIDRLDFVSDSAADEETSRAVGLDVRTRVVRADARASYGSLRRFLGALAEPDRFVTVDAIAMASAPWAAPYSLGARIDLSIIHTVSDEQSAQSR